MPTPVHRPARERGSRVRRRTLGLATAAAIAACGLIVPATAHAAEPTPLIHYGFDQAPTGTTVVDESGNGYDATLNRSGASFANGAMSLPGGAASAAPYLQIPTTGLVGKKNLTVSAWLAPKSGPGNTAAAFIGAPVASGASYSSAYWLLNPSNPSGYVKSVVTNTASASAPWGTEVGPGATNTATSGARTPSGLALYTTVIDGTNGKLEVYINGAKISTTTISRDVSSFGSQLVSYLGRSTYNDPGWAGAVDDFAVYDSAFDAAAVQQLHSAQALDRAVAAVSVNDTATESFALPTSAAGVQITWASSSDAIRIDGGNAVVTRPAAGAGDASVTLTATFTAGDTTRTRTFTVTVPQQLSALDKATRDRDAIEIANADNIRTDFSVPTSGANGSTISWAVASGDAAVGEGVRADSRSVEVERPAGSAAAALTLTATVTNGDAVLTRDFELLVQPAPADEADPEAYVWAFFTGEGQGAEKISLGASKGNDALAWNTLNDGKPLFTSDKGTGGLRDPFIIRAPEGDRFYMLATDLKIDGLAGGFTTAQISGSKYIEVWESDDLVNWSEQRHVKVSSDFAGNTWAPEAFWSDELDAFVVFWASNLYPTANAADRTGVTYNRMMYAVTDDFITFSEPKIWADVQRGAGRGLIDSSIAEEDGVYYRFTKDEASMTIREEKSTDLLATYAGALPGTTGAADEWTLIKERVASGLPNGEPGGTYSSGEGPSIFPANEGDVNGLDWFLFIDQPNYHGGPNYYIPFGTDDLDADAWQPLGSKLRMALPQNADGGKPRHGTVIPVTRAEYQKVLEAFAPGIAVSSVAPIEVETVAGSAPTLPQATITTKSGATRTVAVDWDDVDASQYATAGTFRVSGVALDDSRMPVEAVVTVTAAGLDVTAAATTRCVAGKVTLVTTVTNGEDETLTVDVTSPYGSKTAVKVAPGKSASQAFSSRAASILAGEATITVDDTTVKASYAAASCG